jgi:lipid-binding SYLF domain-containing protein
MNKLLGAGLVVIAMTALVSGGCATAPKGADAQASLQRDAAETIGTFKQMDPDIKRFFDDSAGYAVFPNVGKGGLLVGGAHGRGVLYQNGTMAGWCDLSQATIGGQIGGQAYDEVIFFQTPAAVERFKAGEFTFSAQTSAVALKSGSAANAKYSDNVVVFTKPGAGLMAEASIGGQSFSYKPK